MAQPGEGFPRHGAPAPGPLIEQWVDEELDPTRSESVLVHVSDCPDCLHEIEALARMKRALSRLEVR